MLSLSPQVAGWEIGERLDWFSTFHTATPFGVKLTWTLRTKDVNARRHCIPEFLGNNRYS